eukprot:GFYU01016440.1.p2 GENE.GFYU01016440.1~~GFYU01016440.1.p2  ORF type:complete len:105 (-),score=8.20 GFYU01016440.1:566-880(-)
MSVIGGIQAGIGEILTPKDLAHHDQGGPCDAAAFDLGADIAKRAVDELLIGPGDAISNHHRAIFAVMRHQITDNIDQIIDRQMHRKCRPRTAKFGQTFTFGHRG